MSTLKYFSCILLFVTVLYPQKKILIFDPNGVSTSFQFTLSQLTEDSVFVADTLDDSIFNFDAAFLFFEFPYLLSQDEGDKLIEFTSDQKPVYIYSSIDSITFWNHIGVNGIAWLATSVLVDSVKGIDTAFTNGILIDTSFIVGSIPVVFGEIEPILKGWATPLDLITSYISSSDSLSVVIDLFNLIDDEGFLRKVLEYFELIPPQYVEIQFFPQIDTAWVFGGCTGPDLISRNLVSTPERDSITIEPGPSSALFYYDSTGNTVPVEKYYFIITDSSNQYQYELWFHPKSWPSFDPVIVPFDSVFYFQQYLFDIQLIVKQNGNRIDSLSQIFRAEWGLSVDGEDQIADNFSLSQNYPNPFNPVTNIGFTISDFGFVSLKVFDILGNEIATLVNEEKQPGVYEVEFNALKLSSGVYYYQLRDGTFVETKKMLLIK